MLIPTGTGLCFENPLNIVMSGAKVVALWDTIDRLVDPQSGTAEISNSFINSHNGDLHNILKTSTRGITHHNVSSQ